MSPLKESSDVNAPDSYCFSDLLLAFGIKCWPSARDVISGKIGGCLVLSIVIEAIVFKPRDNVFLLQL